MKCQSTISDQRRSNGAVICGCTLCCLMWLSSCARREAMDVSDLPVLFSEVHGTVLRHGAPLAGAEITQEVRWPDNERDVAPRSVKTRADGMFHFASIEKAPDTPGVVPNQPVALQKLLIRHQGVEYIGWRHARDSYQANAELGGKPLRLVCELSKEPNFEGKHYGICRAG